MNTKRHNKIMRLKEEREAFLRAPENRDLLVKACINLGRKHI